MPELKIFLLPLIAVVTGVLIYYFWMSKTDETVTGSASIAAEVINPSEQQVEKSENEVNLQVLSTEEEILSQNQAKLIEDNNKNKEHFENAVANVRSLIENEINKTKQSLNDIEYFTNMKLAKLNESFQNLESKSKAQFEEVFKSFVDFTNESKDNFSVLHETLKKLQTIVVEEFKPKIDVVNEQLKAMQNAKEKADQSLEDLQKLVDDRIYPNTFNKDYAVYIFLLVVAFVLFLTFCICRLKVKLTDTEAVVSTLNKKFGTLNQAHENKAMNEVPGKR